MHMMDKSKLMEALQRLPISFGMSMGVRAKCQKVAQRYVRKQVCVLHCSEFRTQKLCSYVFLVEKLGKTCRIAYLCI